jgi:hypothetical protein
MFSFPENKLCSSLISFPVFLTSAVGDGGRIFLDNSQYEYEELVGGGSEHLCAIGITY